MSFKIGRRLAEGVGSWLHYEWCCNRSNLFNERYLAAPIGQVLASDFNVHVYSEVRHPVLAALSSGPGRKPAVDFAVLDPYPHFRAAVESKWVGKTQVNLAAVVWDLVRLELIAAKFDADCFFLLAGRRRELERMFAQKRFQDPSPSGRARPLLRYEGSSAQSLRLDSPSPNRREIIRSAIEAYQLLEVPCAIRLQRALPFPAECPTGQYQVYCWQVRPAEDRSTFRVGEHSYYGRPYEGTEGVGNRKAQGHA